jgi:hypothetical protein
MIRLAGQLVTIRARIELSVEIVSTRFARIVMAT